MIRSETVTLRHSTEVDKQERSKTVVLREISEMEKCHIVDVSTTAHSMAKEPSKKFPLSPVPPSKPPVLLSSPRLRVSSQDKASHSQQSSEPSQDR